MLQVYRKRDDLPMLSVPLVVVLFAAITGCTLAAAAVMRDGWQSEHAIPGFIAALPLFCLAVSAYVMLIALWRRAASMTVSLFSGIAVSISAGWFLSVVLCLSVFVCAYVYASAFLLRKSRYRRIVCLTTAASLCLLTAGLLLAGYVWRGISVAELPMQIYNSIADMLYESRLLSMTETAALSAARSITVTLPALWLLTAEAISWICEWICRRIFRLMNCGKYFLPEVDRGITTPRYFGAVFLLLSLFLLTTSYTQNPLIYKVLTNCVLVLSPPAIYVGFREVFLRILDRLTDTFFVTKGEHTHSYILIIMLLSPFMIALFLHSSTMFFLIAVYGAWRVLKNKKRKSPPEKTE